MQGRAKKAWPRWKAGLFTSKDMMKQPIKKWICALLGKKKEAAAEGIGCKTSGRNFFKALLLGAVVLCILYATLALAHYFLKVDFRFLILNIMPAGAVRWKMFLTYVLFFLVYYTANSIVLNGTIVRKGKKEWVNCLLCILFNIGGILLIRVFDQAAFAVTGLRPLANYSVLGGNQQRDLLNVCPCQGEDVVL